MEPFKIITFDVEHGSCHVLRTPNNRAIMIDAGSKADFSPTLHLSTKWGFEQLYWLTITHHDSDHLTDINYIAQYLKPVTLSQPSLADNQLTELYTGEFSTPLEVFLEFRKEYQAPALPMSHPSRDWGGVQFAVFHNKVEDFEQPNINDLSIVTFAHYMGWTFIFPGDLGKQGWLKLLEKEEFRNWLSRTNIFIASHHGRDSGYCPEVFEVCGPHLTIVSDKSSVETSVTDKYSKISKGLSVINSSGQSDVRSVLTTRSDGAIYVSIDENGRYLVKANSIG